MPKRLRNSFFLSASVIFAELVVASCHRVSTGVSSGLMVAATLSDSVIARGGVVSVRVTVRNVGADTIVLTGSSSCMAEVQVRSPSGEVLPPQERICTTDLRHVKLAPGGSMVAGVSWSATTTQARTVPGTYELSAGVLSFDRRWYWSSAHHVYVQ